MAIGTPTRADGGTSTSRGAVSSGAITVSVTAGNRLFIAVGGPALGITVSSVSGASLTWTAADKAFSQSKGFVEVWSAHCASTVTAQSITVTLSSAALAWDIVAFQCSGLDTSASPTDGSGVGTGRLTPAISTWTTPGATTTNANDLIILSAYGDFFGAASNAPGGSINNELIDYHSPNDVGLIVCYVIVSATQSSITGLVDWTTIPDSDAAVIAAYKEASAVLPVGNKLKRWRY